MVYLSLFATCIINLRPLNEMLTLSLLFDLKESLESIHIVQLYYTRRLCSLRILSNIINVYFVFQYDGLITYFFGHTFFVQRGPKKKKDFYLSRVTTVRIQIYHLLVKNSLKNSWNY